MVYLVALLIICSYVPWESFGYGAPVKIPAGYAFIWDSPTYLYLYKDGAKTIGNQPDVLQKLQGESSYTRLAIAGIDYQRIVFEIVGLTAAFGIIYLGIGLEKSRKEKDV